MAEHGSVTDLRHRVRAGGSAMLTRPLGADGCDDQLASVAVGVRDDGELDTALVDLPTRVESVAVARRFAAGRLAEWGVPRDDTLDALLIVSELVTNAIVHGAPPVRLRLWHTSGGLQIAVDDGSTAIPRLRRPRSEQPHGRGLMIVARLATRCTIHLREHGKTVWATRALGPLHL
jgi:anti-sigma regulatory factor (Ser/Thr protein kinase)